MFFNEFMNFMNFIKNYHNNNKKTIYKFYCFFYLPFIFTSLFIYTVFYFFEFISLLYSKYNQLFYQFMFILFGFCHTIFIYQINHYIFTSNNYS
jgi:hypothetical protein